MLGVTENTVKGANSKCEQVLHVFGDIEGLEL